eukprot:scaffold20461_cov81-Phaeocystis_antarctica.AAC.1
MALSYMHMDICMQNHAGLTQARGRTCVISSSVIWPDPSASMPSKAALMYASSLKRSCPATVVRVSVRVRGQRACPATMAAMNSVYDTSPVFIVSSAAKAASAAAPPPRSVRSSASESVPDPSTSSSWKVRLSSSSLRGEMVKAIASKASRCSGEQEIRKWVRGCEGCERG